MAQLTPDQRSALDFGQRIVSSVNTEAGFLENARSQHVSVSALLEEIVLVSTGQGTANFLETILQFLKDAIENHQTMIVAHENTELANNTVNSARRKNLLAWNRGTRIFVAELSRAAAHVETLEFALEQCRMALFAPSTTAIRDGDDWDELNTVQRARDLISNSDTTNYQVLADVLLANPGTSRFARCIALILLAASHVDEGRGLQQRRAEIRRLGKILEELRWGTRPEWEPLITFWVKFAELLVTYVSQGT